MVPGFVAEKALGYQQIAAGGLAGSTALIIPAGTQLIKITVEAQAVRWRDDGTAPTAAIGYPLPVGQELIYTAAAMPQLRFIQQTAGAVLNAVYYG